MVRSIGVRARASGFSVGGAAATWTSLLPTRFATRCTNVSSPPCLLPSLHFFLSRFLPFPPCVSEPLTRPLCAPPPFFRLTTFSQDHKRAREFEIYSSPGKRIILRLHAGIIATYELFDRRDLRKERIVPKRSCLRRGLRAGVGGGTGGKGRREETARNES